MFHRACVPRVLAFVFLLALSAFPQESSVPANPVTSHAKQAAARQSAMNLLEEVLAGTGTLALPQNRLAIQLQAFPVLAKRSQPRARALVTQMGQEFSQSISHSDSNYQFSMPRLRQERINITNTLAQSDAELALQFLSATLPDVQPKAPDDGEPDDHELMLQLAMQIASRDPRRALQMAEQQLANVGDLSPSIIPLLQEVERGDAQSGAQLFKDLAQRIRQIDLVSDAQALSFAASLLASEFAHQSESNSTPDDVLRALADTVATAASSPQFQVGNNYLLSDAWAALDSLVPARSSTLRQRGMARPPAISREQFSLQQFEDVRSSGDTNQIARVIAQAPEEQRDSLTQQAAWQFANGGDVERARQFAAGLNSWLGNVVIQQALRNAAVVAGEKGDFASARQLAAQVTDEDSRAILLSQLALQAKRTGKARMAEEMLGEATSLLVNHPAGASVFGAQLAVAQAYLQVNSSQAIPLLERSAAQLGQVLAAAAQLDGFLPDPHSFEGTELILNHGFLYQSLLQPYAMATADLATIDLPAARTLADRLPLPEARLMTELFVAREVLNQDEKDGAQTASRQAANSQSLVFRSERF